MTNDGAYMSACDPIDFFREFPALNKVIGSQGSNTQRRQA